MPQHYIKKEDRHNNQIPNALQVALNKAFDNLAAKLKEKSEKDESKKTT